MPRQPNHRTSIGFKPKQYALVEAHASSRGISIGDMMRRIVDEWATRQESALKQRGQEHPADQSQGYLNDAGKVRV